MGAWVEVADAGLGVCIVLVHVVLLMNISGLGVRTGFINECELAEGSAHILVGSRKCMLVSESYGVGRCIAILFPF